MEATDAKASAGTAYAALGALQDYFSSDQTNGAIVANMQSELSALTAVIQATIDGGQ